MALHNLAAYFLTAFTLCVCNSQAFGVAEIYLIGESNISIPAGNKRATIRVDFRVDGYEVDCLRKYMVIWGHPAILNPNNPQDSVAAIADISKLRIVGRVAVSKGIFGVDFLKEGSRALLWSDAGVLMQLPGGNIQPNPKDMDFSGPQFERESCATFSGQRYWRFSDD
jgi:hypothetical protein